ncbi:MAG: hypothetical protein R3C59_05470 [Planctomycetaceae bacterium]
MKTVIAWMLLLWLALTLEHARPDRLPSGSVVFACAVACLFWLRTTGGCVLAGSTLIVHWLLKSTFAPIDVAAVLLLATYLITRRRTGAWSPVSSRREEHAWWWQPLFVTLAGLTLHVALQANLHPAAILADLPACLIIAVPCVLVLSFAAQAATELGLRSQMTSG